MNKYALHLIIPLLLIFACTPPPHLRKNYYHNGGSLSHGGGRKQIVSTAKRYLGVPYRYGGTTPRGFDCSGFVSYVFRKNGIAVTRSTSGQYQNGTRVSRWRLQPGDLVFFKTGRKRISHVGIYTGSRRFIHAPRTGKKISYADLNNPYWRKCYQGAVSYFGGSRGKGITGSNRRDFKKENRKKRGDEADFSETVHYF